MSKESSLKRDPGRGRPENINRHVGARIRQRRIMLGLTQQQLAELVGVTYQQAHKYEHGINRVAAGRLYKMTAPAGPVLAPGGQRRRFPPAKLFSPAWTGARFGNGRARKPISILP
jgi:DNA-binding XRE family transcriptional regulator